MRKTCPRCTRIIDMSEPLCTVCLTKDNARRANKSRKHGTNTASWQRFRLTILARDNNQCQRCGDGAPPLTAHYLPGGVHTRNPDHYLTLCLLCHAQVDAPRAHINHRKVILNADDRPA